MDVVIFAGLQGAGKSTFYRQRFADSHAYVSRDEFRRSRNQLARQQALIRTALEAGRSVVVDNTSPTREVRVPIIALAREFGARVIGYDFVTPVIECVRRNRLREGKERVPDVAIYATAKKREPLSLTEGFDELYRVELTPGGAFRTTTIADPSQHGAGRHP